MAVLTNSGTVYQVRRAWRENRQPPSPRLDHPPEIAPIMVKVMMQLQSSFGRRGGPWPSWVRWYETADMDRMGPANDFRIWCKYWELVSAGVLRPGQIVADFYGVSNSTVHRAMVRERQRMEGDWPPKISNGFGSSARARRELRLRQAMAQDQARDPESWESWDQDPHAESWEAYRRGA